MKIRLTLAILSLGASLVCGGPVEGRGFGGSSSRSATAPAAAAIPGRAPTAALAAVATAGRAVRTIDPMKVRMAARPTLAARAARRTARTAHTAGSTRDVSATGPKAKPTTARRNGGRRPVPMAPSLAAVGARAPRRLRPILLQRAAQGRAATSPYGSAAGGSRSTSTTGAYGQSYSSERQAGRRPVPMAPPARQSQHDATALTANLTPASRAGGNQPLWLRRLRQSEHSATGRLRPILLRRAPRRCGGQPLWRCGWRRRMRAAWATTVNPTPLSATEPRQPALAVMAFTVRTAAGAYPDRAIGYGGQPYPAPGYGGQPDASPTYGSPALRPGGLLEGAAPRLLIVLDSLAIWWVRGNAPRANTSGGFHKKMTSSTLTQSQERAGCKPPEIEFGTGQRVRTPWPSHSTSGTTGSYCGFRTGCTCCHVFSYEDNNTRSSAQRMKKV